MLEKFNIKNIFENCEQIEYSDIHNYLQWLSLIPAYYGSINNYQNIEGTYFFNEIYTHSKRNIPLLKLDRKKIFFFPLSYLKGNGKLNDTLSLLNYSVTESSLEIQLENEKIIFNHIKNDTFSEYSFGKIAFTRHMNNISVLGFNYEELFEYFILVCQNDEYCDLHVVWLDPKYNIIYIENNITVGYLCLE